MSQSPREPNIPDAEMRCQCVQDQVIIQRIEMSQDEEAQLLKLLKERRVSVSDFRQLTPIPATFCTQDAEQRCCDCPSAVNVDAGNHQRNFGLPQRDSVQKHSIHGHTALIDSPTTEGQN